jgi:hypothetical protein
MGSRSPLIIYGSSEQGPLEVRTLGVSTKFVQSLGEFYGKQQPARQKVETIFR